MSDAVSACPSRSREPRSRSRPASWPSRPPAPSSSVAGDTMVLCTATAGNLRDVDFLPLTVDVEERMYAAGKIPGSFFKREGRAGEKATLTARLIDRPIRPLFPKGWRYETQLVALPMSVDHEHPYDILAMNGASAALMISPVPLPDAGRRGAHRQDRGQLRRQPAGGGPARGHRSRSDRRRLRGGDPDGRGRGQRDPRGRDPRCARHRPRRDQADLRRPARAGREGRQAEARGRGPAGRSELCRADQGARTARRSTHATQVEDKLERQDATKAVEEPILDQYSGDPEAETYAEYRQRAQLAFDTLEKTIIRERIAVDKKRPDGRGTEEIRPISIEVGISPRTHGSALFTRGQTQALQRRRARHHAGGDAARHARAGDRQALLPPLQLPAVLRRGGRVHARSQAP